MQPLKQQNASDFLDSINARFQAFSENEQAVLDEVLAQLKAVAPMAFKKMMKKIVFLNNVADDINSMDSLFVSPDFFTDKNGYQSLLSSLLALKSGDRLLFVPSKAALGKTFLVLKFQVFSAILYVFETLGESKEFASKIRDLTLSTMFSLMAEDVYFSLLENSQIAEFLRKRIAHRLVFLWEHRCDMAIQSLPKLLKEIWAIRDRIVPAFGTMVGTSELLRLTIGLGDEWQRFIKSRLSDDDVSQSLEEFLFGLSHEQIAVMRQKISAMTLKAVDRWDVQKEFEIDFKYFDRNLNPRNFYQMYSSRRDGCASRRTFGLDGPKHTLEEHFMLFLFEQELL